MTEFEHMMLTVCFSTLVGMTAGTTVSLIINFILDRIAVRRAKKLKVKEFNEK